MTRFDWLVSELCTEIDILQGQLNASEKREKEWRDKYNELLNESIKHGETMMGNILTGLLARCSTEGDKAKP